MEEQTTKHIWIPSGETQVRVTQDGTVTIWDDMTMTRRPIAAQGFKAQPPAEKPAARAKRKR